MVLIHTSSTLAPEGLNPVLLGISVRRLAQERLEEKWRGKFFSYQGDTVMIAQMDDSRQVIELTDDCDSFCRLAKIACKAVVTLVRIQPVTPYSLVTNVLIKNLSFGYLRPI